MERAETMKRESTAAGKKPVITSKFTSLTWTVQAAKKAVEDYAETSTLEYLYFEPEMPEIDFQQVLEVTKHLQAVRFKDRLENGVNTGQCVEKNVTWPEIVALLEENRGSSGRFSLVLKNELPCHKDIVGKLKGWGLEQELAKSKKK
jgi:hypothetical protein